MPPQQRFKIEHVNYTLLWVGATDGGPSQPFGAELETDAENGYKALRFVVESALGSDAWKVACAWGDWYWSLLLDTPQPVPTTATPRHPFPACPGHSTPVRGSSRAGEPPSSPSQYPQSPFQDVFGPALPTLPKYQEEISQHLKPARPPIPIGERFDNEEDIEYFSASLRPMKYRDVSYLDLVPRPPPPKIPQSLRRSRHLKAHFEEKLALSPQVNKRLEEQEIASIKTKKIDYAECWLLSATSKKTVPTVRGYSRFGSGSP